MEPLCDEVRDQELYGALHIRLPSNWFLFRQHMYSGRALQVGFDLSDPVALWNVWDVG